MTRINGETDHAYSDNKENRKYVGITTHISFLSLATTMNHYRTESLLIPTGDSPITAPTVTAPSLLLSIE